MKNIQNQAVQLQTTLPTTEATVAKPKSVGTLWRRRLWQWHRTLGLLTILPVMFWALSGAMHPFMAHWFKSTIAREVLLPPTIDRNKIQVELPAILEANQLVAIKNFHLVAWEGGLYYQVKTVRGTLRYFNTQTGAEVKEGDRLYAIYLARKFLGDQTSTILAAKPLTEFTAQYKYINRLLPVWHVRFNRPDGMELYIDTESSRLGTFNDNNRKAFLWIFDTFHNWAFLDNFVSNEIRIVVMITLLTIVMASALSGLWVYVVQWRKMKEKSVWVKSKGIRRYHRQLGVAVALVSLTFTFSGAYHASRKFIPNRLPEMVYEPTIQADELKQALSTLALDWDKVHKIGVIKHNKAVYYQTLYKAPEGKAQTATMYWNAETGEPWEKGNTEYATFLTHHFANRFKESPSDNTICCDEDLAGNNQDLASASLLKTEELYRFDVKEYGFIFKRLPVVKLAFDTPDKQTYFIETTTSRLAAKIDNGDRREGLSFAILHKFLLMDWAGKTVRDLVAIFSALGVLAVSFLGLALYLRR
ncbi:MAG TPA: hypothetical protein DCM08_14315 [Microscillaceae bacterium]|jgi:hypothetical protein|nr:hypothetical protein [Microscillaceae bacterium]